MGKQFRRGAVIAIGGAEDKEGDKKILSEVARRLNGGALALSTVATAEPEETFREYDELFRGLGVERVVRLELEERRQAFGAESWKQLDGVSGLFFTGGDQLRITSQLGDTPLFRRILEMHGQGMLIAGTSAGASMLSEIMPVAGHGKESLTIDLTLRMAPGFGFVEGVFIDQHFAERGRLSRMVAAVTQNPRVLGLGIDEDTACIVEGRSFTVMGSGAVYVVDASNSTWSNLTEEEPSATLSVFDLDLHILSDGTGYDLNARRPKRSPEEKPRPRDLPEAAGIADLPIDAVPAPLAPRATRSGG
ncbi:MAG TPA: cyanophycinase, partial [Candidatus Caenarcaniphilales bacterium]|nr:cyanophycinase [Candidatus Caenarcaniphilales bacterium]